MRYNTILLLLCLLFSNVLLTTSCSTNKSPDTEEQDDENENEGGEGKKKKKNTKEESEGTDIQNKYLKGLLASAGKILNSEKNRYVIIKGDKLKGREAIWRKIDQAKKATKEDPDTREAIDAIGTVLQIFVYKKGFSISFSRSLSKEEKIEKAEQAFDELGVHESAKNALAELKKGFESMKVFKRKNKKALDNLIAEAKNPKSAEADEEEEDDDAKELRTAFNNALNAFKKAGEYFKKAAK